MGTKATTTASDLRMTTKARSAMPPLHPLCERFPLLDDCALAGLAESIKSEGLHHPILTYKGKILDGRHRYLACEIAGVTPKTIEVEGSLADAVTRVIAENVKRRHMTPDQVAAALVLIPEVVELAQQQAKERADAGRKKGGKARHESGGPPRGGQAKDHGEPAKAKAIAALSGGTTSTRTVERALRAQASGGTDLVTQIKDGKVTASRSERRLRDKAAADKRSKKAEEDAVLRGIKLSPPDIRRGDFAVALADVRDVDLVLTDPPYPREFLPQWSKLSAWAAQALKPGHLLVAYSGQMFLPEVIARLSEHLTYVWCGWLRTPGPAYTPPLLPVMSLGRPILFFARNKVAKDPRFVDEWTSEGSRTGDEHEWQQSIGVPERLIEVLTRPNDLVADPFLGAGTFALAAKTQGRRFVGAEINEDHFNTSTERVV